MKHTLALLLLLGISWKRYWQLPVHVDTLHWMSVHSKYLLYEISCSSLSLNPKNIYGRRKESCRIFYNFYGFPFNLDNYIMFFEIFFFLSWIYSSYSNILSYNIHMSLNDILGTKKTGKNWKYSARLFSSTIDVFRV